jgi:DNA-binding CsgD family transcriptional regulator
MNAVSGNGRSLWRSSPERWTERRSQYLESEYGLEERHAVTVAWSELGYSSSGIAERAGFAEGTVRAYLDELAESVGEAAVWAKRPDEIGVEAPLGGDGDE